MWKLVPDDAAVRLDARPRGRLGYYAQLRYKDGAGTTALEYFLDHQIAFGEASWPVAEYYYKAAVSFLELHVRCTRAFFGQAS